MLHIRLRSRTIFTVVAGGLTAMLLTAAAYAVTSDVFQYSTPQTGYFSIDRMAMTPTDDPAAADFTIDITSGEGLSTGVTHCFNSGVNLPEGATIVRMTVWYSSVAESNPAFSILRQKLVDGQTDVVAFKNGNDDSGLRKTLTANANVSFAAVDNTRFSYGFRACIGQLDAFYAARIQYTYTNAGD